MRIGVVVLSGFFLWACGGEPEKAGVSANETKPAPVTSNTVLATDTDNNQAMDTVKAVPGLRTTKKPGGVYQFLQPNGNGQKILHTVAFYPGTFRLQEDYLSNRDSAMITEGTWATTEGFIWLYKDQILRARYTWKGDTLQFYSPRLKKTFSLQKQTEVVTANPVWQTKKAGGSLLYSIGTEPFWSLEITKDDSAVLSMPDWTTPLKVKVSAASKSVDSLAYVATTDSLRISVHPYFCSDGMSDFLYTQKVTVRYRGQTYRGCGEVLRRAH